jgi:hypothetical protein
MNVFFSELALKTLCAMERTDGVLRTHDLHLLFEDLQEATRQQIVEAWEREGMAQRHEETRRLYEPAAGPIPQALPELIVYCRHAFEHLRYLHERDTGVHFFVGGLSFVLGKEILRRRPDWHESNRPDMRQVSL